MTRKWDALNAALAALPTNPHMPVRTPDAEALVADLRAIGCRIRQERAAWLRRQKGLSAWHKGE